MIEMRNFYFDLCYKLHVQQIKNLKKPNKLDLLGFLSSVNLKSPNFCKIAKKPKFYRTSFPTLLLSACGQLQTAV